MRDNIVKVKGIDDASILTETEGFRLQKIYPPAICYSIRNTLQTVRSLYEHIRSLHQLENLYYNLAGNKLDLRLGSLGTAVALNIALYRLTVSPYEQTPQFTTCHCMQISCSG